MDIWCLLNTSLCWRSWSWLAPWRPTRSSRTNNQKRCPFHHKGLKYKNRKSRDVQSNRQIWPWSTKWSRAKANRVLSREHAGHSNHAFPTTQEMTLHMNITRWSILNQIDYVLFSWRWKSSILSAKTRPGADCDSDHELLITKLQKVGKTTRQLRYDLNQIP